MSDMTLPRLRLNLSRCCGLSAAILAAISLILGWYAGVGWFLTFGVEEAGIAPATCVGLVLLCTSLALAPDASGDRRLLAGRLAFWAAALAVIEIVALEMFGSYAIDQMLAPRFEPWGRMSVGTAAGILAGACCIFMLLSGSVASADRAQLLALALGVLALAVLLNRMLTGAALPPLPILGGMSVPTAAIFVVFYAGVLFYPADWAE